MTIKPNLAIARLFAAIIYADGYLSQHELQFLEESIKPKYKISNQDFQQINKCSFAQAIQVLTSHQGIKWLEDCYQTTQSIVDDMETMALCDGQISPKESLICLCARLAFENDLCSIVTYIEDNFRFSKSDVIYVESSIDAALNEEIENQYDSIQYILNNFGYNFIYIPRVREEFISFSDIFRKQLLQFLFPENKHQEALDAMILSRLPAASTCSFSNMLLEAAQPNITFTPSLLIKLPTKHPSSPHGQSDFALIKIQGGVLQTIQTFFKKYNALSGCNYVQVQNGSLMNKFQCRGFHKTFIEYLRNVITDIQIHIQNKIVVRYGSIGEVHLPHRLLAAYLTMLYFSIKEKPFCKDWKRIEEQYIIFKRIYTALQPYHSYEKEDFYANMQIDYGKIASQYFGNFPNKNIQKMAPVYDRAAQTLRFLHLPPVQVVLYSATGKPSNIPFTDWVDNLPT